MRKKSILSLTIMIAFFLLSISGMEAQAGTKDMVAGKRTKFKDDSTESMRDVFARKEAEEQEYRKKMLSNSDKTVKLLTQVRDLLIQLNAKKH